MHQLLTLQSFQTAELLRGTSRECKMPYACFPRHSQVLKNARLQVGECPNVGRLPRWWAHGDRQERQTPGPHGSRHILASVPAKRALLSQKKRKREAKLSFFGVCNDNLKCASEYLPKGNTRNLMKHFIKGQNLAFKKQVFLFSIFALVFNCC